MTWFSILLLSLAPLVGLVILFFVVGIGVRIAHGFGGVDFAPGWQVRCTHCGKTRPAGEVGVARLGKSSTGTTSRTLGWCTGCKGVRWIAVEASGEVMGVLPEDAAR
ncbi:MAG: hypothetical protein AAF078_01395 [Planctomycetota bacterium]